MAIRRPIILNPPHAKKEQIPGKPALSLVKKEQAQSKSVVVPDTPKDTCGAQGQGKKPPSLRLLADLARDMRVACRYTDNLDCRKLEGSLGMLELSLNKHADLAAEPSLDAQLSLMPEIRR